MTLAPARASDHPDPPPAATVRRASRRRAWVLVAVALAAVGFLLLRGVDSAAVYFFTADQVAAKASQLGDSRFRVEGTVMPGTVAERGDQVQFCIENAGAVVPVVNSGYPPQLFQPDIPVVLEGHLATRSSPAPAAPTCGTAKASAPTFVSNLIMVKHTAVYRSRHPDRVRSFVGK